MENQIKHKWFFNHPPTVVWDYLTRPELLAQWLMPSDFKLEIGHQFIFTTKPKPQFGFDGRIYCRVLNFEILKNLSYSWRGGEGKDVKLDSVVNWILEEKAGGTELTLEHTGFKGWRNYLPYLVMNKGWQKIGKRLAKQMDNSWEQS